jgi:nucleotide-binding universal stress UspA family protein
MHVSILTMLISSIHRSQYRRDENIMFQTIVFAYDGSVECRNALEEGIALAVCFSATCHLLAVIPSPPALSMVAGPLPEGLLEKETDRINAVLEQGVSHLRDNGLQVTGTVRMWEEPTEAIASFARETDADLVIVGHHQRATFDRWWHGSVGHSLLDRLPCSLFVSMPRNAVKQSE